MSLLFFLKPCYAPLRAEMPSPAKTKKSKRKFFNKELIALRLRQKQEKESILTLILDWFLDE
jgi:hypothetical protein